MVGVRGLGRSPNRLGESGIYRDQVTDQPLDVEVPDGRIESFYVLEGKLTVMVGDKQTLAEAGTSVFVPAGAVHTFQVASPEARFITTTSGDKASAFFRDLASTAPGIPNDETLPLVIEVAKRNGLTSPLFD